MAVGVRDRNELEFAATGDPAHTTDDPWSRMTYYFHCVTREWPQFRDDIPCAFIHKHGSRQRVANVSSSDIEAAIDMADRFSPRWMCEHRYWIEVDRVPGRFSNDFVTIGLTRTRDTAAVFCDVVALARQQGRAEMKVMIFQPNWAQENYYQSLAGLRGVLEDRRSLCLIA